MTQTSYPMALQGRTILLIIAGGIAAYKSLELIRRLREQGAQVRAVLTQGGAQFVTPLSVAALSEQPVATDLWALTDEQPMRHIRLSREADAIIVAPATANRLAKLAQGVADDLASTLLLAADKPIFIAPAMNPEMWRDAATQANLATLIQRGVKQIGPGQGSMACGETGEGRMAEPAEIITALQNHFAQPGPLAGRRALVTSGPTHEPLDPVRYIANRSSGKQGHAIAMALARQGAAVTLITGPTALPDPPGLKTVHVETAREMLAACEAALPADIAICAAAVSDWRPAATADEKIKKSSGAPTLQLVENPDILATLSQPGPHRPRLVIGFAAETENAQENAAHKLKRKGCDGLLANDVGGGKIFGADTTQLTFHRPNQKPETWPQQSKQESARQLTAEIIKALKS